MTTLSLSLQEPTRNMKKPGSPVFWNLMAKRYSRQPIADEAAYQKKLEITQSYLTPEMELLEFGCGTGGTALIHAPHVRHIQAIDFSQKMIDIAREKAKGTENVTFDVAAIEDLKEPPASFDAILGLSILHLLRDRHAVMARVHQLLKPGGLFFSSTVCVGDMGRMPKIFLPLLGATGLLPKVRVFSADELAQDLRNTGFEIAQTWRPASEGTSLKAVFIVARKPG